MEKSVRAFISLVIRKQIIIHKPVAANKVIISLFNLKKDYDTPNNE
jgi:hypothetical protein